MTPHSGCIQVGHVNLSVVEFRPAFLACRFLQCWIIKCGVIPEAADQIKLHLLQTRNEVVLCEVGIGNHVTACPMEFLPHRFNDQQVPVNQVGITTLQGLTVRSLNGL
jgi:hypothetical protein